MYWGPRCSFSFQSRIRRNETSSGLSQAQRVLKLAIGKPCREKYSFCKCLEQHLEGIATKSAYWKHVKVSFHIFTSLVQRQLSRRGSRSSMRNSKERCSCCTNGTFWSLRDKNIMNISWMSKKGENLVKSGSITSFLG
jgi:hypothetical protein